MSNHNNILSFSNIPDELALEGSMYATPELSRISNMFRGGYVPERGSNNKYPVNNDTVKSL